MLFTLQFPIVDARVFIDSSTDRLIKPEWPEPKVEDRPFVRGFGQARHRKQGGLSGWPGEDHFCDIRSATPFRTRLPTVVYRDQNGSESVLARSAYRRFHATGSSAARFEFGFACHRVGAKNGNVPTAQALAGTLKGLFEIRIQPPEAAEPRPLLAARKALASAYLKASTVSKHAWSEDQSWWVSTGSPVAFIELMAKSQVTFGRPIPWQPFLATTTNHLARPDEVGPTVTLSFGHIEVGGIDIPTWTLCRTPDLDEKPREAAGLARRARLHLMRLHSEIESAREILRLLANRRLKVSAPTNADTPSERLSRYVADVSKLLTAKKRDGVEYDPIFDALKPADLDLQGDLASVFTGLADARREVKRRVRDLLQSTRSKYVIQGQAFFGSTLQPGAAPMKQQNVTASGSAQVGNVVQADSVSDSFNQVQQSGASDEIKLAMNELRKEVKDLLTASTLDADQRTRIERSYDVIAKEAASKTPDRAWYSVSAEGLKDAAKAVGSMTPSLVAAVTKVVKLLAGA